VPWLWLGVGSAIVIAALVLLILITSYIDYRIAAKHRAITRHGDRSDIAMVQTIQDTVAEMFDAVRRQR